MCGKCYEPYDSNYQSNSLSALIASFHFIGSDITVHTSHSPLDVVKIYSKLILWALSLEVRKSYRGDASQIKLTFDTQHRLFRKKRKLFQLKSIPIFIAMSHLNMSLYDGRAALWDTYWMPKIRILKSFDLPFVMWITEHFEFITCSALSLSKRPENTYFSVFDETTWIMVFLSLTMSAVVARIIILCSGNSKSKVIYLFKRGGVITWIAC